RAAGQVSNSALGSERETNGRNVDEAWLDAATDSVDGYTAVDDGRVTNEAARGFQVSRRLRRVG
ncbi:hypothetical protein PHYSODRAFT_288819, partial [Phytophthora sojae]